MILTREAITELTGKERRQAQAAVLRHLGIAFKQSPDGSLVVLETAVSEVLGGKAAKVKREFELDGAAVR